MVDDRLKAKLSVIPELPGVYKYFNRDGVIIYVGKAKNLHRRVNSYFNREHDSGKTNALVRNIADVEYIVVNNDNEAFLLENSLIKENQPHYNILLKDDKSYPWICVTKELFPRVFITRNRTERGARYYGPYSNSTLAQTVMTLLRDLYPIRTCAHSITHESIHRNKIRPCLLMHLNRCRGCCNGSISDAEYNKYIDEVREILNGNTSSLMDLLRNKMMSLAEELRFEEAEEIRKKYVLLERYCAKTVVVSAQLHNLDVFSFVRDEDNAFVNFLHVRSGSITTSWTTQCRSRLGESDSELLEVAIEEARAKFPELLAESKEIIVPFLPDTEFAEQFKQQFVVPERGDKRKLLILSEKNAKQYQHDLLALKEKMDPEKRVVRILSTMQKDLRLNELPRHIECFDNSNIQGTNPVASCVVFRNAKPCKKDYRHFNIKTVEGPDDFESMREILTRRYSRLLAEGEGLPQLIIVDGGKGQLSSACEALDSLGLRGKIAVVGLAKRLEEIYFPGDSLPLYLPKDGETLKLIKHLDDEAHHFGITFHRNKRSKSALHSTLDDINGIGTASRTALMKHFKSLKRLREARLEDIATIVGMSKATLVFNALKDEK